MMVIIGAIIVIGVIYLLLKRHESRMVLIGLQYFNGCYCW